jgi:hypothetical protein
LFTKVLCPDGPLTETCGVSHELAAPEVDGSELAAVLVDGDDPDDGDERSARFDPLLQDASNTTTSRNAPVNGLGRDRSLNPPNLV